MNRFKLVYIGIVMIIIVAVIGSCSKAKAGTVNSYYKVDILMNQDDSIDELIEKLLEDCLCK